MAVAPGRDWARRKLRLLLLSRRPAKVRWLRARHRRRPNCTCALFCLPSPDGGECRPAAGCSTGRGKKKRGGSEERDIRSYRPSLGARGVVTGGARQRKKQGEAARGGTGKGGETGGDEVVGGGGG
ncbi:hypothetical protein CDD83_1150 [Cordyceps sp. RAO-2017]|nr:hypothetical protein CDD83_1150 [Cordyceps sp. RAO-2017]